MVATKKSTSKYKKCPICDIKTSIENTYCAECRFPGLFSKKNKYIK